MGKLKKLERDRGPDKSEAVPCSGAGGCQCGVIIVIYSTLHLQQGIAAAGEIQERKSKYLWKGCARQEETA